MKVLLFCRSCLLIVDEVNWHHVPFQYRCPRCGKVKKVYWHYHWDGKMDSLKRYHLFMAVMARSRMGSLLKLYFPTYNEKKEESIPFSVSR